MVLPSLEAAEILAAEGISTTVVNCRFMKPYDAATLASVVAESQSLLVVEEGSVVNGFGSFMAGVVAGIDPAVKVITHGVPDVFIEQAPRAKQLAAVGLDVAGIVARVRQIRLADSRGAQLRAG
jgi:1-deoxy-D-xylulose-5-phosphate synthase